MNNILFKPWEGHNFGKSELGRLLIIGDSHYFLNDEDESVFENFTIDIIGEAGDYYVKFLNKISEIFEYDNPKEFWSNVAFANAIQSNHLFVVQTKNQRKMIIKQLNRQYKNI